MPILRLVHTVTGVQYSIKIGDSYPVPGLFTRNYVDVGSERYYKWDSVENITTQSGVATMNVDNVIPNGVYYIGDSSTNTTVKCQIDKTGVTFKDITVHGTVIGSVIDNLGSDNPLRVFAFCSKPTSYGDALYFATDAKIAESEPTEYVDLTCMGKAVSLSAVSAGFDKPYNGDPGHGGGAGDSGGTGGSGTGINDGDQISTHSDLDETGKQALLGYGLNAYVIDSGNLLALHKWLWGYDNDYMDALWKKWQNYKFNPMAGIVACHRLPNELKPATASAVNVKLAGLTLQSSGGLTGVSAAPFSSLANRVWTSEYTVNIEAPKGDFTDFANVQMGIFLPFCGTMALDASQIMGRPGSDGVVRVQYCCNALTGDCTAFVRGTDQFGNTTMLGVANGNCAETHPLCGNDNGMSQKVSGLMSVVGGLAGSILTQSPAAAVGGAISGVSQVMAAQNHTQIIGQPGGANGWASLWTCYVYAYWNVPIDVNDDGTEIGYYSSEYGRPSMCSGVVSDFSGFTMLLVHADGIGAASDEEKREIERLCAEGIII